MTQEHPVTVIGAGPIGLAAAAHLATRGMPFVVVEAGDDIGASLRDWAHVRLFSPWRWTTDPAARELLAATGWTQPDPDILPTGGDLIRDYLQPLAAHPAIAPSLRLGAAVTSVSRKGFDKVRTAGRDEAPFVVRLSTGEELLARAIIDASGTWRTANPLGGNGLPARGETAARAAGRVFDGMPDVLGQLREQFAGKKVAVVGAGHSAMGTLLALTELATTAPNTEVAWVLRTASPNRVYGGGDADALPARGSIGTRLRELVRQGALSVHAGFFVDEVSAESLVAADGRQVAAEVIVNATGARPDHTITTELRLDVDPILGSTRALAPLIDPNLHSCGTVPPHGVDELAHPESGFYVVGAKSYGRAPTFLLATGFEQARSVVAAIDGDWTAARDVKLELPQTGVCSTNVANDDSAACCGTAPETPVATESAACCGPATKTEPAEAAAEAACCGSGTSQLIGVPSLLSASSLRR
jgi:2-polyprenyl-6-methoxyphenol hydroxylase-like FAD-dependent oxidoreductase